MPGVGGVAQLGERRVRNAEVGSSILLLSTNILEARPCAGPQPSSFLSYRLQRCRFSGNPLREPLA